MITCNASFAFFILFIYLRLLLFRLDAFLSTFILMILIRNCSLVCAATARCTSSANLFFAFKLCCWSERNFRLFARGLFVYLLLWIYHNRCAPLCAHCDELFLCDVRQIDVIFDRFFFSIFSAPFVVAPFTHRTRCIIIIR